MRYLTLPEVLDLHRMVIRQTGGSTGVRDLGALESAIAQPRMTFGGQDLYASLEAKATAPCFSLVSNHPFLDGNKRVGHAAMESFLILNGFEFNTSVEEAERIILALASGELARDQLLNWVTTHIKPLSKT